MEESRRVKRIFNQKLEGKRLVGRAGAIWADNIHHGERRRRTGMAGGRK